MKTFKDYVSEASANIVPPSGNTITPSSTPAANGNATPTPGGKPTVMWAKGVPAQKGMTVGLKGTGGAPVPGEITQVDTSARGVKVLNPTTGQEEWHGNDDLQPFANARTPQQTPANQQVPAQPQMSEELTRMRQLAGIGEDASCGATGAGAIAIAPSSMGNVKRRQPVDEAPPKEYTPKAAKTVVGDTKPHQATGELSANLAARGQKTASRINNGFKR